MDFNIGSALHFASKGEGYIFDRSFYDSPWFEELYAKITSPAKGTKTSYDFGLVTNKVSSINP